jgi:hypothetical protein
MTAGDGQESVGQTGPELFDADDCFCATLLLRALMATLRMLHRRSLTYCMKGWARARPWNCRRRVHVLSQ